MSYKRIVVNGSTLNQRTVAMLKCAQDRLGYNLYVIQGSYNAGGVAASAGTHDGGGAMDVSATSRPNEVVLALREVGFAAWHRPYNWDGRDGSEHIHAIAIGDREMSSGASNQVYAYYHGLNGLANNAPDPDPRVSPIPVWKIKFPTVINLVVKNQWSAKTPKKRVSIKRVQNALAGRGYYKGKIDGLVGPETKRAYASFLNVRKIKDSGPNWKNLRILCKGYNKVV